MAKQLTIHGVSEELIRRLGQLGRQRGQSLNTVARSILEAAVLSSARRQRLHRYAAWTAGDVAAFDRALADQRVVDDELWKKHRRSGQIGPR